MLEYEPCQQLHQSDNQDDVELLSHQEQQNDDQNQSQFSTEQQQNDSHSSTPLGKRPSSARSGHYDINRELLDP